MHLKRKKKQLSCFCWSGKELVIAVHVWLLCLSLPELTTLLLRHFSKTKSHIGETGSIFNRLATVVKQKDVAVFCNLNSKSKVFLVIPSQSAEARLCGFCST